MLTINDFASLALYVYHDPKVNALYLSKLVLGSRKLSDPAFRKKELREDGFYEVIVDNSIQGLSNLANDFYGSVFIKVENNKPAGMVIAVRGTVLSSRGNDEADIKSWWKSVFNDNASINLPEYYVNMNLALCHRAHVFAKSIGLENQNIYVTGHSLGGAIAALMPTLCGIPVDAVTFNAPGIAAIKGVRDYWDRVINFRAEYDFVSAINQPIGAVWNIHVPEDATSAERAFKQERKNSLDALDRLNYFSSILELYDCAESIKNQHSMVNLWKALQYNSIVNYNYESFEGLMSYYQTLRINSLSQSAGL